MKTMIVGVIFVALNACSTEPNVPSSTSIPCTFANETEDAWLHDHCELTRYGTLRTHRKVDDAELPPNSNFIELITITDDMTRAKFFRCASRPAWYVGGAWRTVASR